MRYIKGIERNQKVLFPESIDEYVEENNLVRFIEAFTETLDMKELDFVYSEPKEIGRKAYNPAVMLKLYIYGYIQKIRSSRRLEAETQRNVELMWLMEKLTPDFKTIADFRKDNIKSVKKVFREFTILCKRLNLFGKELTVIDGSKFKAVNGKDRCYTRKFLKSELKEIDEKIEVYLEEIEKADKEVQKPRKIEKVKIEESIKKITKEREEIQKMLKEIESGEKEQISKTDSDSRMMKQSDGGYKVSYNAQISVDSKHHLIIDTEVTNEGNDRNLLSMMSEKSKEVLEAENLRVVADTGYYKESELEKCEEQGIECYIPSPKSSTNEKEGRYGMEDFRYDEEKDIYICPEEKELTYRLTYERDKKQIRKYEYSKCNQCLTKQNCTLSKGNKVIYKSQYEQTIKKVRQRCRENPEIIQKRSSIVEHIFGTMKQSYGYGGGFLLKGIEKVKGEFSLMGLVYNIKRVQNILGVRRMIESLQQA
jgi:Transposase and inactivated derivatives